MKLQLNSSFGVHYVIKNGALNLRERVRRYMAGVRKKKRKGKPLLHHAKLQMLVTPTHTSQGREWTVCVLSTVAVIAGLPCHGSRDEGGWETHMSPQWSPHPFMAHLRSEAGTRLPQGH